MVPTKSFWLANVMALFTLLSSAPGQIEPNPDSRVPFSPFPNNGPVAGTSHFFFTGAMGLTGGGISILAWNGDTGQLILSLPPQLVPSVASPVPFPFSVHRYEANGAGLGNISLYNGRANSFSRLDYLEDDDPQRLNPENFLPPPGFGPRGGRAFLNRRSHLRPENQAIVPFLASTNNAALGPCFILATPCKLETYAPSAGSIAPPPNLVQGGVLFLNYGPLTYSGSGASVIQSPAAMSIWTSSTAPPAGLLTNSFNVTPATSQDQAFVCSDLATGVISNALTNASPSGVAWISRTYADGAGNSGDRSGPGQLNIAALSLNPSTVTTVAGALASPFSPYATKILVWNDLDSFTPQAQWLMVPCQNGVELWNPRPAGGGPPTRTLVIPSVAAPDAQWEKEVCSNVSYLGVDPASGLPCFIFLERRRGEFQAVGANQGVNFVVFDTAGAFRRGPGAVGLTLPGLLSVNPNGSAAAVDVVRNFRDITIAPPQRSSTGGSLVNPYPNSTAWFSVWDADSSLNGSNLQFGAIVGVENQGTSVPAYADGGAGFNATGLGQAVNVRYFIPTNATGLATAFQAASGARPVPVGGIASNPIFKPFTTTSIQNQNLIAWHWDNGAFSTTANALGYGIGAMDVVATWSSSSATLPGGAVISTGLVGQNGLERSQETITTQPRFGYMNYPLAAIIFAQRQAGIEPFQGGILTVGGVTFYQLTSFAPAPLATGWVYQKRSPVAWYPPTSIHAALVTDNFVGRDDMAFMVEGVGPGIGQQDDWPAYFVDWRVSFANFLPFTQGGTYPAWFSPSASLGLGSFLNSTTAPPQTITTGGGLITSQSFYTTNQTPLWADWLNAGSAIVPPILPVYRTVLRTHSSPFPSTASSIAPFRPLSDAWVGLGGEMFPAMSLGRFSLTNATGQTIGNGNSAIIVCHIDQRLASAGLPPSQWPQGNYFPTFEVSFLYYQADSTAAVLAGTAPGPGYEMRCVNPPITGGGASWMTPINWFTGPFFGSLLNDQDILTTEILAL